MVKVILPVGHAAAGVVGIAAAQSLGPAVERGENNLYVLKSHKCDRYIYINIIISHDGITEVL
jgi:hypothetical protein